MATNLSDSLQSKDTRNLLDVIDSLRSQGISNYVDLPQIIVCGEQSSGKSSVLEAISGLTFPVKDNLCTRFATELILRRSPDDSLKITITPGPDPDRTDEDLAQLRAFGFDFPDSREALDLCDVIEQAKSSMGISEGGKRFSSDILRIELSGPEQPHLTLVDLPGMFESVSALQTKADRDTVRTMVLDQMQKERSVILAVVSAKNDFVNQSITRHARRIDPKGLRTMGLITKPDTLDEGSDSERFYISLARNEDVKFRLGWHVLRNRDYRSRDSTLANRNEVEKQFFAKGAWTSIDPSGLGVSALRSRLSKVLKEQILIQIPSVLGQIEDGIADCESRLARFGESRTTLHEQRKYLFKVSQIFTELCKNAVDGTYVHPFFGRASTDEGGRKRLRAVVRNLLEDFEADMRANGHTYGLVEGHSTVVGDGHITRAQYIEKVQKLLRQSRGRELPGTFDPLIIGELFSEQCQPWREIIDKYVAEIVERSYQLVHLIMAFACDQSTSDNLLRELIYPQLDALKRSLHVKISELLRPHYEGHPITLNHYLTENVQKAQAQRWDRELKKALTGFFGINYLTNGNVSSNFNLNELLNVISSKTEADMSVYAASTATDFMEAYYKVALKNINDDVAALAIEACLIQGLPSIFSPMSVLEISDDVVRSIAAEDDYSIQERSRCEEKLKVLKIGLQELQTFVKHQPILVRDVTPMTNTHTMSRGGSDNESSSGGTVAETQNHRGEVQEVAEEVVECIPEEPVPQNHSDLSDALDVPPTEGLEVAGYAEVQEPMAESSWFSTATPTKKKKGRKY